MTTNLRGKIKHATRQSGLSRWLLDGSPPNYKWFGKELLQAGTPNWDKITELLANEGLTDKNGNPYQKDAIRLGINRFFKKHPVLLPATHVPLELNNPPEPVKIDVSKPAPDFIALSQEIKNRRTIK